MGGVGQLPSGSFQARVQIHGEAWSETFRTAAEARDWLLLMEASRIEGSLRPRISMAAFADLWIATLPRQVRARHARALGALVLPVLGARPVASVVPTDVRPFLAAVGEQACDRCCERVLATLDALFDAARAYRVITRSPVAGMVRTRAAPRGRDGVALTSSKQAAATIDAALGLLV